MRREDIELYAFLYFCGGRDRQLLTGTKETSFSEFDRLYYLVETMGLNHLGLKLWNQYSVRFEEEMQKQESLENMSEDEMDDVVLEERMQVMDTWIREFCKNAPNTESRRYLRELLNAWD